MVLPIKSKLFQVRADPDLFDNFRLVIEQGGTTVSEAVRSYMRHVVSLPQNIAFLESKRERDLPVRRFEEMSRQERRAQERVLKKGR